MKHGRRALGWCAATWWLLCAALASAQSADAPPAEGAPAADGAPTAEGAPAAAATPADAASTADGAPVAAPVAPADVAAPTVAASPLGGACDAAQRCVAGLWCVAGQCRLERAGRDQACKVTLDCEAPLACREERCVRMPPRSGATPTHAHAEAGAEEQEPTRPPFEGIHLVGGLAFGAGPYFYSNGFVASGMFDLRAGARFGRREQVFVYAPLVFNGTGDNNVVHTVRIDSAYYLSLGSLVWPLRWSFGVAFAAPSEGGGSAMLIGADALNPTVEMSGAMIELNLCKVRVFTDFERAHLALHFGVTLSYGYPVGRYTPRPRPAAPAQPEPAPTPPSVVPAKEPGCRYGKGVGCR